MAIPLHKRRKVADFDPVRDGKTVTQFCKELGISRQTYHNIKNRIAQKGRAGIVPDSTAPKNPFKKFDEADKIAVVHARQQLMEQGLDYGPWSIYYFLFDTPSPQPCPSRINQPSALDTDLQENRISNDPMHFQRNAKACSKCGSNNARGFADRIRPKTGSITPNIPMPTRIPLYLTVATTLRDEINSSVLVGYLPSESSLQQRFDVSRSVIRQALSLLESEGLLSKSQGRQTEVINPKRVHRVAQSLNGLGMQALLQEMDVRTKVLTLTRNSISGDITFRRIRFLDGVPFCVIDTQVPFEAATGVDEDSLEQSSLHDLFRSAGNMPTHSSRSITAIPASEELAALLELPVGAPLLVLSGNTTNIDGDEIERFTTFHAGTRVALDLETST